MHTYWCIGQKHIHLMGLGIKLTKKLPYLSYDCKKLVKVVLLQVKCKYHVWFLVECMIWRQFIICYFKHRLYQKSCFFFAKMTFLTITKGHNPQKLIFLIFFFWSLLSHPNGKVKRWFEEDSCFVLPRTPYPHVQLFVARFRYLPWYFLQKVLLGPI